MPAQELLHRLVTAPSAVAAECTECSVYPVESGWSWWHGVLEGRPQQLHTAAAVGCMKVVLERSAALKTFGLHCRQLVPGPDEGSQSVESDGGSLVWRPRLVSWSGWSTLADQRLQQRCIQSTPAADLSLPTQLLL